MSPSTSALGYLLLAGLPVLGFLWAVRRPGMTRGRVLGVAMLGGLVAGLLVLLPELWRSLPPRGRLGDILTFVPLLLLWFTLVGGAIGLAGLLLRAVSQWLAEKP